VQTLVLLLLIYLKYSMVVMPIGIVIAAGMWFWLGLAGFAKQARLDR